MMKSKIIVMALLVLSLAVVSCSKSLSGKYVSKDNPNVYIEFNSDGTFQKIDSSKNQVLWKGKYIIKGDRIELWNESGTIAIKGRVRDNTIETSWRDGIFVKQ